MRYCLTALVILVLALPCAAEVSSLTPETLIWFDAPAANFTESTPLGNGRLGAMMFGGADEERIVLNENSVWSGSRQDADRPDAYKALPEIQRLLLEGKNSEAEALVNAHFVCQGPGSAAGTGDSQFGCYQTLGNFTNVETHARRMLPCKFDRLDESTHSTNVSVAILANGAGGGNAMSHARATAPR
jgi:alpha-L-fucosidase 2